MPKGYTSLPNAIPAIKALTYKYVTTIPAAAMYSRISRERPLGCVHMLEANSCGHKLRGQLVFRGLNPSCTQPKKYFKILKLTINKVLQGRVFTYEFKAAVCIDQGSEVVKLTLPRNFQGAPSHVPKDAPLPLAAGLDI